MSYFEQEARYLKRKIALQPWKVQEFERVCGQLEDTGNPVPVPDPVTPLATKYLHHLLRVLPPQPR